MDNSINQYNISYFRDSKWNIEGLISISNGKCENAYGEIDVQSHLENNSINIHRVFSMKTENEIMYFEFEEEISANLCETNILKYKSTNPLVGENLKGLYVLSFDYIHAMYAEVSGGASVQEVFIRKSDDVYINNGIMFRNGRLYLRWDFVYKRESLIKKYFI